MFNLPLLTLKITQPGNLNHLNMPMKRTSMCSILTITANVVFVAKTVVQIRF